jgi:hypothetical protein
MTDASTRGRVPSPAILRRRYVDQGQTITAIAQEFEVGPMVIGRALTRAGIDRRPRIPAIAVERLADERWLRREYVNNRRVASDIARELQVSPSVLCGAFKRHGISTDRPVLPCTRERQAAAARIRVEREREELRAHNHAIEQANEAREAKRLDAKRLREERRSRGQCLDCADAATSGTSRCDTCRARRYERDQVRSAGGTPVVIEPRTPDNRPAVVLRVALGRHRDAGLSFRHGWALALQRTLDAVNWRDRNDWREALEFARPAFEDTYLGGVGNSTIAGIEPGESVDRY